VLVDRLVIGPDMRQRLVDTTEICYREAAEVIFERSDGGERLRFSERFECKRCGLEFLDPEPRLFSFNSPFGACPRCQGFGNTLDIDMDRVIPNRFLSLDQGAIEPWTKPMYRYWLRDFRQSMRKKVRMNVPFCKLTAEELKLVMDGAPDTDGIRDFFRWLESKKYKLHVRVF